MPVYAEPTEPLSWVAWIIVVLGGLLITFLSTVITEEKHYKFIVFFGKYYKTVESGLSFKFPIIMWVDTNKTIYLGRQTEKCKLTVKTQDGATITIGTNVTYKISEEKDKAYRAVYDLEDYKSLMHVYVDDVAISKLNKMTLEDVFDKKEEIQSLIEEKLNQELTEFGITVEGVFLEDPTLPNDLVESYNRKVKAARDLLAADDEANAIKKLAVGKANADGESIKIRMTKMAEARDEFAGKSAESIKTLVASGATVEQAMDFLKSVGDNDALVTASRNSATIVMATNGNGTPSVAVQPPTTGDKKSHAEAS